ncbi:asparagine synthase (glutamine-hydrolyzing) [Pseudoalteromonas sp. T1lg22]|uniref:asparagine synthase (glutamine-hydrolyzing) n=1 Tax=Pseudoalteromonas sp. T1lg22 TaxID=2077096 RepID=UPI000CF68351|nr:asparagine synthase (glutamine-hydrolyzing) [Pseudoalteromonas sp. T1lg22]
MCGFAGFISKHESYGEPTLLKMLDRISHRGPDDFGVWSSMTGVYLGHRRLAIHDLSGAGHQPMHSNSGRYTIVFNGEIYNFEELREVLPSVSWRGHSDTEVMLHAIEKLGLKEALKQFNGMFAFALWDNIEQSLTLARDRFGEKPLYYGYVNGQFVFASELTSIESGFGDYLSVDANALSEQASFSYIPAPLSIYNEIKKIEPGCFVKLRGHSLSKSISYWKVESVIAESRQDLVTDEKEAVNLLDEALKKAVKLRMAADVPLGAFLSGGVDSSTVVALMQSQSDKPINTFSIGFNVPGYNEAEFAKEVANYLGTTHHERYFSREDVLDIVPTIAGIFDEPFSDASQIPTLLVSRMAKEKVTVALSGDGGDELFSGYKRYIATVDMWSKISKIPAKKGISALIKNTPTSILNKLFFFLSSRAEEYGRQGAVGPKIKNFAGWLDASSITDFYEASITHWKLHDDLFLDDFTTSDKCAYKKDIEIALEFGEFMLYLDTINYLPGDILTKVDRTAMHVSLEGRIPMLDHNVFELAWRMPYSMKQKGSMGKWPLKQVMYKYLPRELMDRPKMGFGVPIHEWLKDELKEWAQDLLSYERIKRQGIYNPSVINKSLEKHISNEENNSAKLWDVLMVQAWFDADKSRERRIK